MTGEVQPVCDRCGHTPLEHSAGPCHQRSAAGVGCDCGGWAEIVTGGDDAATQPAPSGDPIDTDEMIATWRPAPPPDDVLALCDEVDRLRIEADTASINAKADDAIIRRLRAEVAAFENVAEGLLDEALRLRAEVDVMQRAADYGVTFESKTEAMLAAALHDIAGMRHTMISGREMWMSDAECSDMRGGPCHAFDPDSPEDWCPVCVAEICWCAWKMGVLAS